MTASQWLGLVLQGSIMLTVLGLGLTATFQDATFLFRRPALLLRAVLSMNIIMPVIACIIATTFAVEFEVKVALVALAVSPVPPIIQKKQITAGGRREYVVGLLVAMSVLAIVLVPLTVVILNQIYGSAGAITPFGVALIMLKTVFAPLIVGLLIRRWLPAAERASAAIIGIAGVLLLIAVVPLVYGLWPIMRTYLGNGLLIMCLILALIGLLVGHLLGGPRDCDRTALAISTASRHPAVALAIATSGRISEPKPELAIILLYLVVATIASFPYQKWRTRTEARAPQVASGTDL